ncbi:MAG TPA: GNAT family N-acetyltransferase [Candidatus Baltobacteraceae bacterium]|nr:GNAT family N-acetyltransferase [Candidatus Baltobacteraceae bacterium]
MPKKEVIYQQLDGSQAVRLLDDLCNVYIESFGVSRENSAAKEVAVFRERFPGFCESPGFSLVTAGNGGRMVGFGYGITLPEKTGWWSGSLTPLPEEIVTERAGRTFAFIDLAVIPAFQRQGIASQIHDTLLAGRTEERATLTVHAESTVAHAAYAKWGWHSVGQRRNPMPGNPLVDIMVKPLQGRSQRSPRSEDLAQTLR